MKKTKITLCISLIYLGLFFVSAHTVSAEVIKNFNSTITVNTDSTILVKENIVYDFEGVEKHGIFRTIPLENYDNKSTEINVISVMDENNNPYNFTDSISNNILTIKIGDADTLISGVKEYDILYQVYGAIGYFDKFDEIYWNVTGNDWQVQIENASAQVILPSVANSINRACYYGHKGENNSCEALESNIFNTKVVLDIGEGLTIASSFSKGVIKEPTKFESIMSFIFKNIILLVPIFTFIFMFLKWKKNGKDPKGYSTIIAQYEPPTGMKPTLVGALIDGNVNDKDITAGLIYLAEQGFVKIRKLEKNVLLNNYDYEIKLIKNDISSLDNTEKDILGLFFTSGLEIGKVVNISDFVQDFSFKMGIGIISNNLYKGMTDMGFYEKNPSKALLPYIIFCGVTLTLFVFILNFFNPVTKFSLLISWVIVLVFGLMMGKRTKKGAEIRDYILGFKMFLSVTEKDRLNFHNAPEKNPEEFMKCLPYAMALGVEKKWAKQFEGIYMEQPSWYSGHAVGAMAVADFASDISSLNSGFQTGQSGSGGGGSSGGGGGGGGGGSW